ncbi:MAG TPA: carbohydrate kinase [Candidatus Dormibacteraeota bacterium]|nr:carbohydrate kinase [Candidatus Dormibacteraeota bacterium]
MCGEALIDMVHHGDAPPRATPGGGPFNTARALARLGAPAAFLGRLSSDEFGEELARLLASDGASLELASIGPEPTTIALAGIDAGGRAEYRFLVDGTSAPNLTREMVPDHLGQEVDALHVGSLGMVLEPMATTLVDLLRRERDGRVVMLDPNIRPGLGDEADYRARLKDVISRSTIVKASDADLAWLYPDHTFQSAADRMIGEGVPLVVVTLGAEGAYGAHGEHRVRVDAVPVPVVDTIGAGDAFGAAVLAWMHDHHALRPDVQLDREQLTAALRFACQAAAITCSRSGADPPWRWEMPDG